MNNKIPKLIISLQIFAQKAEIGPPLGTVLGNAGINTVKFVKEYNEYTQELPDYFKLRVKIYLYEDKSYNFLVELPTIGYLLSLAKMENKSLFWSDLIKITKVSLPNIPLKKAIPIILGSLGSAGMEIPKRIKNDK